MDSKFRISFNFNSYVYYFIYEKASKLTAVYIASSHQKIILIGISTSLTSYKKKMIKLQNQRFQSVLWLLFNYFLV